MSCVPTMTCPKCGAEHENFDGFGFVAHTKPAYPDGCGWCSHPARDLTPEGWRCGICGDVRPEKRPYAPPTLTKLDPNDPRAVALRKEVEGR